MTLPPRRQGNDCKDGCSVLQHKAALRHLWEKRCPHHCGVSHQALSSSPGTEQAPDCVHTRTTLSSVPCWQNVVQCPGMNTFCLHSHEESNLISAKDMFGKLNKGSVMKEWQFACGLQMSHRSIRWMSLFLWISGQSLFPPSLWPPGRRPLVAPLSANVSALCGRKHGISFPTQCSSPVVQGSALHLLTLVKRVVTALVQASRHHCPLSNFILPLLSQQPWPDLH